MLATSVSELQEKVASGSSSSKGMHAKFFDLENGWGIKSYEEKHHRNISHRCQKEAAKLGLGPEVGDTFEVKVNNDTLYCMVTEKVDMCVTSVDLLTSDDDRHTPNTKYFDSTEQIREEVSKLCCEFEEKTGYDFDDDHLGNFGVKNNELIIIDFDRFHDWYQELCDEDEETESEVDS